MRPVILSAILVVIMAVGIVSAAEAVAVSGVCSTTGLFSGCSYAGSNFSGVGSDAAPSSFFTSYPNTELGTQETYFANIFGGSGGVTLDGVSYPSCQTAIGNCSTWTLQLSIQFLLPSTPPPPPGENITVTGQAILSGDVTVFGSTIRGFHIDGSGIGTISLSSDPMGRYVAGPATALFSVVPEPSTIVFLASGLGVIGLWQWRRDGLTNDRLDLR